jgi:lipopolysaccharide transport system ATP-binding protein
MRATLTAPQAASHGIRDVAISVSHLSKQYHIVEPGEQPRTTAEAALAWVRQPRGNKSKRRLMALDDVSFEVARGEIVGIVGRNGAGKSTLLKVLTRITAPTKGRVSLAGQVGSLLDIGTGFHPELTGRENVFLNGTLLGMKKKEILRCFDEIVAFAGIAPFLDTQVKRYSTGMYVRLAFGVAAHLQNEILVVDEVLAVGDADFQAKCLSKMRDVAQTGRTVLLVSHQLQTVATLATSGIFLQSGRLTHQGHIDSVLEAYKQTFETPPTMSTLEASMRQGSGERRFESVATTKALYEPHEEKIIEFSLVPNDDQHVPLHIACQVLDQDRVVVAQCDSRLVGVQLATGSPSKGQVRIRSPWLKPGRYSVDMIISSYAEIADYWEEASSFEVAPTLPYRRAVPDWATARSPVLADFSYDFE